MEHYERQLARNIAMIADTFESLEKIEDWTERDKQQVEQEIQSIIVTKEKQLKEQKEKKLKTARKNKQPVQEIQPLDSGSETYAEAVKKHIHQKLNPNKSDPTGRRKRPDERTEDTMKPHDGTENRAIDATNNNQDITTSMKEIRANHNGGIF